MKNKKFLGVCYGISEKFDFDVTIVRVAFIILALAGPLITFIFYLLLSLVFPEEEGVDYIH